MEKITNGLRVSLTLSRFFLLIFVYLYYKIVQDVLTMMCSKKFLKKNCFYSFYFKNFQHPVFLNLNVQRGVGLVIIKVNHTQQQLIQQLFIHSKKKYLILENFKIKQKQFCNEFFLIDHYENVKQFYNYIDKMLMKKCGQVQMVRANLRFRNFFLFNPNYNYFIAVKKI